MRTLFINPTEEQKGNYAAALEVQNFVLGELKVGARCSEIYRKTMEFVKAKHERLLDFVGPHFGHGIGLEFRESVSLINEKNDNEI